MSIADPKLYGVEPFAREEAEKRLGLGADWRRPSAAEADAFAKHRVLPELADVLIAAADPGDESWILLERDWFGFPDPPRFEFIVYRADGATLCQASLDRLPPSWRMPEGVPFEPSDAGAG